MFRELSAPISVQWEVTPWCNLECVHCYNYWRQDKEKSKQLTIMLSELYDAIVSEILNCKVFRVTITGGEPLGVLKHILPSLRKLTNAGVQLGLNTNLTLLTKETASILKDELGITSILGSFPSANPLTNRVITQRKNAHADTTKGIEIALESGMKLSVNMVITKINLLEVYATAEYLAKLGVRSFAATKASVPGNCPDFALYALTLGEFRYMLRELVRVKEELGLRVDSLEFYPSCSFGNEKIRKTFGSRMCTAGKTSCTIGFDGQLRPCPHAPMSYGGICESLSKSWRTMHDWRTDVWLPQECHSCVLKNRCAGGCKTDALFVAGSLNEPDPYCDFSQLPIKVGKKSVATKPVQTESFVVNPEVKLRKEDFGGILYVSPIQWASVNHRLYQLVARKGREPILLDEMAGALDVPKEGAVKTVSYLVSKSILQEGR